MKPDPKHIAVVQDGISGWQIGTGYYATRVGTDEAWDIAEALLTSTDPAVLDAMQDALVRAGRLHEDCVREVLSHWTFQGVRTVEMRRFVTDWREVDDA